MTCKDCGSKTTTIKTPQSVHYGKEVCTSCGKFQKWLKNPDKPLYRSETTKLNHAIFDKINHECQICGRNKGHLGWKECLEIHHLKPLQEGGKDEVENVIVVCSAEHLSEWQYSRSNHNLSG